MSIAGVIIAIIALLVSFLGLFAGWLTGIAAIVLAAVAILLGALSLKSNKGKPAIIVGAIALVLAILFSIGGAGVARDLVNKAVQYSARYEAETGKESLIARYANNTNTSFGIVGFFMSISADAENIEADGTISDRLNEELDYYNKLTGQNNAAATAAPTDAPAGTAEEASEPEADEPEAAPEEDAPAVTNTADGEDD